MKSNITPRHQVEETINAVLTHYSVLEAPIALADITGPSRLSYVAKVRMVIMYVLKTRLEMSYPEVGAVVERDHSSVLSACRRVANDFDQTEVAEVLDYVNARLERQRRDLRRQMFEEVEAS